MTLDQAKRLRPGTLVHCPADRGDGPYTGTVVGVDSVEFENVMNVPYVLVEVQHSEHGTKHLWPSNRLS